MSTKPFRLAAAILGLVAIALPAFAHHSLTAVYDPTKPIIIKGKLTRINWANPHIFVYLDVPAEGGKMEQWAFESGPPVALTRAGVKRSDFIIGDEVTITAWSAKDGSKLGRLNQIKYSDGHVFVYKIGTE
jgi:hypothetical protein